MPIGSSDLSDLLIESDDNILRPRTAQTGRTVNPVSLSDAESFVTIVVAADLF